MTENDKSAPIVDQAEGFLPAPWEPRPGEMAAVYSTLTDPLDTLKAINDTMPVTALAEKPAKIVHIVCHSATVVSDAGEETDVTRTILVGADGVNYAAVSDGILGSVKQISNLYGPPPWDPPLKLKMIEKQTRRGYRTYRLIPA